MIAFSGIVPARTHGVDPFRPVRIKGKRERPNGRKKEVGKGKQIDKRVRERERERRR